jgi:hypothetical protein
MGLANPLSRGGSLIASSWAKALPLVAAGLMLMPASSTAQLPFGVTDDDLSVVDTTAFHWRALAASVGSVEGELRYAVAQPGLGECRAVATLGMFRLRNYYMKETGERPVSLRLQLHCGEVYRGRVAYDGINTSLELTLRSTGEQAYHGRIRGLP